VGDSSEAVWVWARLWLGVVVGSGDVVGVLVGSSDQGCGWE
jgi:hypothetical protein